jgi:hypothetical protein
MAQHSRKDCGHLRVFLLKHLFCHVFPISQWWGALQTSHLERPTQNWYFAGKGMQKLLQKAAKGNEKNPKKNHSSM